VVAAQDHDQVGNRAAGERNAALTSDGRLRVAAALLLTSPFVPMLFQGEEWGATAPFQYFTDHVDLELGRLVSDGRRREFAAFGWQPDDVPDPQAETTFERSVLDWAEPDKDPHAGLLQWHKDLIALRRSLPALSDGDFEEIHPTWDEDAGWFCLRRGPITVAANLAAHPQPVPVPDEATTVLLASHPGATDLAAGTVTLPADAVAIVSATT